MKTTFTEENTAAIRQRLEASDVSFRGAHTADSPGRQPVHTVYGGAHLFRAETAPSLGAKALDVLRRYAPDAGALSTAMGVPKNTAAAVYDRVVAKLEREPVEDYRIDFEDGYGVRPDNEEDAEAERVGRELVRGMGNGTLPPFVGIRIKPLTPASHTRGMRTLDLVLTTLLDAGGGAVPSGFAITLPKVTRPEEVSALADLLKLVESNHSLGAGSLRMEIMVETPQAIINERGQFALPSLIEATRGRCRGVHFGPYDYTALCEITAEHQQLLHPACDYARQAMLAGLAQRGVFLSDGPTNIMPISRGDDAATVHRAWRLHVEHIRHSLENGFYQSWDLHPAQLPSRYAAIYSFFLDALPVSAERLRNFLATAARASMTGHVFDDAATGQGLLNFFLRGLGCGALTEGDVAASGLTIDELRLRSFSQILEKRRGQGH